MNTPYTTIIAEVGVNHNGSIDRAKEMIDVAVKAGVDIVKFQTFTADSIVSKGAEKADYQKEMTSMSESQHEMIKKLELDKKAHIELIAHCDQERIEFLSSPFDHKSIDLLSDLGLKRFKIPSGEITNLPYLQYIGKQGKSIILSTGMATLKEIRDALNILQESGTHKSQITVLHCNTEYPTPMKDVNLKAMLTIKDKLDVAVGYSDHTLGIEIPVAAVALGASVIEKHFTLDRTLFGPDHHASIEPDELKAMVQSIRNIEKAMGNGVKTPSPSEMKNLPIVRKSIVAKKQIMKGEQFSEKNLTTKRPGTGISPMKWDLYIGKLSNKEYQSEEPIQ